MATDPREFWAQFALDPRHRAHRSIRASDQDREIIHVALAEAYSVGRITPDEHDERVAAVSGSRTLGELVAIVADLVVVDTPVPVPTTVVGEIRATAELQVDARIRRRWIRAGVVGLLLMALGFFAGGVGSIGLFVTIILVARALSLQRHRAEQVLLVERQLEWKIREREQRRQLQSRSQALGHEASRSRMPRRRR